MLFQLERKMSQSSNIYSHSDIPLEEHLSQVAKVIAELVESKPFELLSLSLTKEHIKALALCTGVLHDIGKATSYFQRYCSSNWTWRGPNGEERHSGLSAILAYKPLIEYCQKNGLKEWIARAPLIAIAKHHSPINLTPPDDMIMADRIKEIKEELYDLPDLCGVRFSDLEQDPDPIAIVCAIEDMDADLKTLCPSELLDFRIFALFLYSVLLEADKAYLAVKNRELYQRKSIKISPDCVNVYRNREFGKKEHKAIYDLRDQSYQEVMEHLETIDISRDRIHSLTLPTGMGKTVLAAACALKMREKVRQKEGFTPQIIVALPFLSIIDQSAEVYRQFLDNPNEEIFLTTHSLSPFEFNGYEANTAEFFINTWKSQITMTTFDQLFYSLFSFKPKHLMRFHNLFNSIIVLDEVQSLPPHLWDAFCTFFIRIAKVGRSHLLVMSATQPGFLKYAKELVPTIEIDGEEKGPERYFKYFQRYKLVLNHKEPQNIQSFVEKVKRQLPNMVEDKVMIVLNTRDSARKVFEELKNFAESRETYFLSSYVIPAERLERIRQIKNADRVLVVTTQCIEAGVDIDMDYVIRDFGPFDSIIQVAGRCNREGEKSTRTVEIIRLRDPDAVSQFCPTGEFNQMVYHDFISTSATLRVLAESKERKEILENEVFSMTKNYFREIRSRRSWGQERTQCLLNFSHKYKAGSKERPFDIRNELRGNLKQYTLIVEERNSELRQQIEEALSIQDRWTRRLAFKKIAGLIANFSISVNAYKFDPEEICDKGKGNFYYLKFGYYDKEIGFNYVPKEGCYIV